MIELLSLQHLLMSTCVNAPLLSVDRLTIETSSRTLSKISHFDVYRGELLAIMGPSGIGKRSRCFSRAVRSFLPETVEVEGHILCLVKRYVVLPGTCKNFAAQRPAVIFKMPFRSLKPSGFQSESQLSLALTGTRTKPKSQDKIKLIELLVQLGFPNPGTILPLYPSQISGGQHQRSVCAIGLLK